MGRLLGPTQDLRWWAIVYAVAITPIDFEVIGLTSGSGPDVVRWAMLLPVWFLPLGLIGPRWSHLFDALRRPPWSWLLAWAILGILSVTWATVPKQAVLIGLAMAGQILLAGWYVYTEGWERFASAAATGLVIAVAAGVAFDAASGTLLEGTVEGRALGLTTGPTTQARLAAFAIILGAAQLVWNRRSGRWSNLPAMAIGICCIALIFAETRTSIAAAVLGVGYGLARKLAPLNRWLIGGGLAILVLALLGMTSAFVDLAVFGERGDPTSVSGRTDIWPIVIDLIAERPLLGYGWGAEEQLFIQAARSGRISFLAGTSHSILLSPLLSGGVLGFCLLATGVASALRLRRRVDPWITAIILAILLNGLTEAIVHRPSVSVFLLSGCLAAVARMPRWHRLPTQDTTRAYWPDASPGVAGGEFQPLRR